MGRSVIIRRPSPVVVAIDRSIDRMTTTTGGAMDARVRSFVSNGRATRVASVPSVASVAVEVSRVGCPLCVESRSVDWGTRVPKEGHPRRERVEGRGERGLTYATRAF